MSVTIPEVGSDAEGRQAEQKAMADRLKAMIDRVVEDASDELFDAIRNMCPQDDTAPGKDGSRKRPSFGENDLSDLQLMVALRSVSAIEAAVCNVPKDVLMSSLISATDLGALVCLVGVMQASDEVCGLDPLAGPVARTIKAAKELKINVSAVAEMALINAVAETRCKNWLAENAGAFAAQSDWHEHNGHPLADIIAAPGRSSWTP